MLTTLRRRVVALSFAAALAGGVAPASPASAHQDHGSCGEGARAYVVSLAHAGIAEETASGLARDQLVDDNVAAAPRCILRRAPVGPNQPINGRRLRDAFNQ